MVSPPPDPPPCPVLLERALQVAVRAHAGQRDRNGVPYVFHPIRVMMRCGTPLAKIAALLHDVVEDTPVTMEDLRAEGFPGEVLRAVALLTHEPAAPYETYIDGVLGDRIAVEVKMADLEENADIRRLRELDEQGIARLRNYQAAYRRLAAHRGRPQ